MTTEPAKITAAVAWLYRAAGVPLPSAAACVAPLRGLVAGLFLDCVELPQLTIRAVAEYLSQYGITVAPSGDDDRAKLAGYLHVSMSIGFIFVNQPDRVTRRRFSSMAVMVQTAVMVSPISTGARKFMVWEM